LNFLGGLFSKEDIGSYAASVREEKGNRITTSGIDPPY
jgi:hypothetical protein